MPVPSSQISRFSPYFFPNSFSFILCPVSIFLFREEPVLMVWTQACALSPSSSPKPCSRNHRPRAATRKMVGRYTQQASSRITAWRVGHIIYRVSHVKLPTCWFITKPKQHRQGSILSSCLGWQVALSLKKNPKQTQKKKLPFFLLPPKNKESNNKKHQPPKHRNPCHNPGKKITFLWKSQPEK